MKMKIEEAKAAGAKVWEKNEAARLYFHTSEAVAAFFGNVFVSPKVPSMVPAGFEHAIKEKDTKSYYDMRSGVFYAECGEIANVARAEGLTVKRI